MALKDKKPTTGSNAAGKKPDPKKDPDDDDALTANWAVPKVKHKAKHMQVRDARYVEAYAQRLYHQAPDTLRIEQEPLPDAQLRTPIYQKAGSKDLPNTDANRSSATLRDLFNTIKARSLSGHDSPYHINNLSARFGEAENAALVLSRAVDQEILTPGEDLRLVV